jgi:hypothetical protein
MKKIASILLICILLFNWFGYRFLISFAETNENAKLESQLDENNFDETQLVSIKIPMRYLPYATMSGTFERVDGQIEIAGVPYKYVKRRIQNDSLEILCIPNQAAIKWQKAKNEFFRFANDLQPEKKLPPRSGVAKNFSTDNYIQQETLQEHEFYFSFTPVFFLYPIRLSVRYLSAEDHPPQIS